MADNTRLVDALRRRFRNRRDVMAALGLDYSLLGEDHDMTYRNNIYAFDSRGRARDAEEVRREEDREARDRMRRAMDSNDPYEMIEELADQFPEEFARCAREIAEDRRGPRGWARDKRELRAADRMLAARPRKFGRDEPEPFYGRPEPGGTMTGFSRRDDDRSLENFGERRGESRREELGAVDRRRAHDMAFDAGSSGMDMFRRMFGEQAAAIEPR
jgi:hypothetical protein